jgi:ketosteroid isomerase-like protein
MNELTMKGVKVYHQIVRSKVQQAFADINAGRYESIVTSFAQSHRHIFFGQHALAGIRTGMAETAQWYQRLPRLIPDLKFELHRILVSGMPWNTTIMAEWTDHFVVDGKAMSNSGVHRMHMKWGKITELAIYCDTQKLAKVLEMKAARGMSEAGAAVIGTPAP